MIARPNAISNNVGYPWLRVYVVIVGVGMICSFAIATTFEATRARIAGNRSEALRSAVLDVLPGTVSTSVFLYHANGDFAIFAEPTHRGDGVVAGYDERGSLVGIAIEASGYGYQDVIRLIYGYSPCQEKIVGFRVLESRETPGLGDRVEFDKDFQANVTSLDVAVDEIDNQLINPIVFIDGRSRVNPWEVDGVSGATVTSRAIASILSESSSHWVPRIRRQIKQFRKSNQEFIDGN